MILEVHHEIMNGCVTKTTQSLGHLAQSDQSLRILEPRREKTDFLHMRKQRRRSASR